MIIIIITITIIIVIKLKILVFMQCFTWKFGGLAKILKVKICVFEICTQFKRRKCWACHERSC